ncbi:MAG: hypothetical protein M3O22_04205 [Pseudomonadota bacterium]|nr:hypothetical protein [Pseudomonadota bacterium]
MTDNEEQDRQERWRIYGNPSDPLAFVDFFVGLPSGQCQDFYQAVRNVTVRLLDGHSPGQEKLNAFVRLCAKLETVDQNLGKTSGISRRLEYEIRTQQDRIVRCLFHAPLKTQEQREARQAAYQSLMNLLVRVDAIQTARALRADFVRQEELNDIPGEHRLGTMAVESLKQLPPFGTAHPGT